MNAKVFFILAILVVVATCSLAPPSTDEEKFQDFVLRHRKFYTPAEYKFRFEIFKRNLQLAAELDARDDKSEFGVTKFMDLSQEEFRERFLIKNFTRHEAGNVPTWTPPENYVAQAYPASYDWSSKNALTPVYNQEQCGSCWAFSTTENIESMWFLSGKPLTRLSMQQIVDCDDRDDGCNGGEPNTAYEYVINAGGLEPFADYPYVGIGTRCTFDKTKVAASISSWQWITRTDDEAAMQSFTYSTGPPSICVDATIWQYYRGGVITTSSGCGTSLDHCVQLTGWQTINGVDVWNVRNSWGADWGNNGYIWVERGSDVCGIGQEVSSSTV